MRLSIVIITFNEWAKLEKCLRSIRDKIDPVKDEVIVVDNGSADGTKESISNYPFVNYNYLEKNLGVGPARNIGISISKGEFIMILDNDTEVLSDGVIASSIVNHFEQYPKTGVVGFRLLNSDKTRQESARSFPSIFQPIAVRVPLLRKIGLLNKEYRRHLMMDQDFDKCEIMEVDYVLGANQVYKRALFDELGGYDQKIFFGPEDMDFCLRACQMGYRNYFSNDMRILHDYQRRTRKMSLTLVKHISGFIYLFLKHRRFYRLG